MSTPGRAAVTLIARFTALPGHRAHAAELIRAYAEHVRAIDGCVLFEPTTASDHPLRFIVFERYRDQDTFDAHLNDPENASFNAALSAHVAGPSRLEFLDAV